MVKGEGREASEEGSLEFLSLCLSPPLYPQVFSLRETQKGPQWEEQRVACSSRQGGARGALAFLRMKPTEAVVSRAGVASGPVCWFENGLAFFFWCAVLAIYVMFSFFGF